MTVKKFFLSLLLPGFFSVAAYAQPTAPSGLGAFTVSSSAINVVWADNSNNETGFEVERSLAAGSGFSLISTNAANSSSFGDAGLTAGTTYYYRVRAINGSGNSAYTSVANATTYSTAPPAAPGGLGAFSVSASQINVVWTDNSNNETGFQIERSLTTGTGFSLIFTTAANSGSYADMSLSAGTQYYYRIRATNSGGNSAYTSEANATTSGSTLPAAPSGLAATATSSTTINLTWSDNSSNETGFQIERSLTTGTGFTLVTTTAANAVSYSSTSLTANTQYFYRIRATNASGNSAYTSEANAITFPLAPTAPSALASTAASSTTINLTWTDNSSNETGFQIERSLTTGTGFTLVTTTAANAVSYSQYILKRQYTVLLSHPGNKCRRQFCLYVRGKRYHASRWSGSTVGTGRYSFLLYDNQSDVDR